MKKLTLISILFISSITFSQSEDAWVFFKDKENIQQSINNPISILTQEAIDRKTLHNIPIDERDVPVNENYITQIKNTTGITVIAKSKWFNCVYVRGTETNIRNLTSLSFVDRLDFADNSLDTGGKKTPSIKQKKNVSKHKFATSTDFSYGHTEEQIKQLQGDYLHQQGYTGKDMIIAVIDGGFPGVDTLSVFSKAKNENRILEEGYDFVNRNDNEFTGNQHGTRVLSSIAGSIDGEFIGTAPDAKYLLFTTEDSDTEGPHEEAFWVEAIERADSLGVDVINTSLSYAQNFDNSAYEYKKSDLDGQTAFSSRGANIAFEKGMLLVNGAGNYGHQPWKTIQAPADSSGVLTVGSVDDEGVLSFFSSIGPTADNRIKPDVMARGTETALINSDGSVTSQLGTSYSSPIIAGLAACLWQAFPTKTNEEIMQLIRQSAHLSNSPTNEMGYGIPNFKSILEGLSISDTTTIEGVKIYPNPVQDKLIFQRSTLTPLNISIYTLDGKIVRSRILENTNEVSLEGLSQGMYILEVVTDTSRNTLKLRKL